MEEAKPGSGPKPNLDDVDAILSELDPEFKNQWGTISTEIRQISTLTGLESINLSADYLKEGAKAEETAVVPPLATADEDHEASEVALHMTFGEILWQMVWQTLKLPFRLGKELFKLVLSQKDRKPLEIIQSAPEVVLPVLKDFFIPFQGFLKKLKTFDQRTFFKLAIILGLIFGLRYIATDMKNHFKPDADSDPFLKSWNGVADSKFEIPPDDDSENIENPLRHPEYTVLVHRIVANLKPTTPRGTPMVAIELYIEASNQDCAIEIHDRDLEVRDQLERVLEETTFADIDSKAGKERLKVRVRGSLDQILTKGHVKRVFFSALNASP